MLLNYINFEGLDCKMLRNISQNQAGMLIALSALGAYSLYRNLSNKPPEQKRQHPQVVEQKNPVPNQPIQRENILVEEQVRVVPEQKIQQIQPLQNPPALEQKIQLNIPANSVLVIEQKLQQHAPIVERPVRLVEQKQPQDNRVQLASPVLVTPIAPAIQQKTQQMHEALLNAIRCPISLEIMEDPVITVHGQTYERKSIQEWFDSNHRSDPMTNLPLDDTTLITNYAMKGLIEKILSLSPDPKKTREEIEAEQKVITLILQPLEKYAYATGFQAMTKNHQSVAQHMLIKLRTELHILNRCEPSDMQTKLDSVCTSIQHAKPNKEKGDYLKSLIQVEKNIKEHYQTKLTATILLRP